jgi:H+/Cl- antiporter ClcA
MFSGQHTMTTLIAEASTFSAGLLLIIAFAKLFATTTLIRTGFFGGPIFPALFAGAALGLAFNTIFHSPEAVAISATIAGIMTISLRRPLSAALITIAIAGAGDATIVALAVSAGLIVLTLVERRLKPAAKN